MAAALLTVGASACSNTSDSGADDDAAVDELAEEDEEGREGNGAGEGEQDVQDDPAPDEAAEDEDGGGAGADPALGSLDDSADRCPVGELDATLQEAPATDGSRHFHLVVSHTGSEECTLTGFAGLSLLDEEGEMIGEPAAHDGEAGEPVALDGGAAYALVQTGSEGATEDECWEAPSRLQVYPPGSDEALTVATEEPTVCGDRFEIGTLRAER